MATIVPSSADRCLNGRAESVQANSRDPRPLIDSAKFDSAKFDSAKFDSAKFDGILHMLRNQMHCFHHQWTELTNLALSS